MRDLYLIINLPKTLYHLASVRSFERRPPQLDGNLGELRLFRIFLDFL